MSDAADLHARRHPGQHRERLRRRALALATAGALALTVAVAAQLSGMLAGLEQQT